MTIHIRHISDAEVEVTLTPGWLARVFGAKVRRGIADRDACDGRECGHTCDRYHWWWKATEVEVPRAIEREIECTTVEDLPRAEARRR